MRSAHRTAPVVRRRGTRGAFTLIELLLVLVILAVLAAVVVPKFTGRSEQAKLAAAKTDISMLDNALDLFEQDTGRYPSTDEGLRILTEGGSVQGWKGPYIKRGVPNDPWGNPYKYLSPGLHGEIDVFSLGADNQPGGAGEDADIGSWDK